MQSNTGDDNFLWAQKLAEERLMAVDRKEIRDVSILGFPVPDPS
jgi:hypothetical protein